MKPLFSAALLCTVAGCQPGLAELTPAVLQQVNAQVKTQLQQAIVQLNGGAPVKLSDSVLTKTNTLIIEQAILRDQQGLPITGRHQQQTETFSLWLAGKQCWLRHQRSEKMVKLQQVQCSPMVKT